MIQRIFFYFFSSCLFVCSLFSIETYEDKIVQSIAIVIERPDPDVHYDLAAIAHRLQTKERGAFSQIAFDQDLKLLSQEYDRVEPSVQVSGDHLTIELNLWPRPLIESIDWSGNEAFATSKLEKELDVTPGTYFHRQEFNKKFKALREFYIKKGYFASEISYKIFPIQGTNRVAIDISLVEGKTGIINQVDFHGFTSSEISDITSMIYTQRYRWFLSWFTGTGTLRQEVLDQDKMVMLHYLHNKGYADARVDISLEDAPSLDRIDVVISAHRGPLYRYGSIGFTGNEKLHDQKVESSLKIHEKDVYSPDKLRETAQAIRDLYGEKGYIEARVDYEVLLQEKEPIFNVQYYIDEGEEYRIGLIRIIGNTRTQSNVLLRESLLVPGETFDARRLQLTQQKLQNIGYFKNVNVYAVASTDNDLGPYYRDVYIEVEEMPTGNMSVFSGFSTLDNVYGGLELTERNFNIAGITRLFSEGPKALRGGGEYFHIRLGFGAKQTNYLISWMDPYVNDSLWRLGFEIVRTTSNLQSTKYDVNTAGFSVFASYPLTRYWTYGTKYRFRYTDTDVNSAEKDLEKVLDRSGILSSINQSLSYNSTDRAYKPRRGLRSGFEAECAGLGGAFRFAKTSLVSTFYLPLWDKGTVKLRGDTRFIFPFGNQETRVPTSEKFFLGGETTVRGYEPFHIGPIVDGEPIGGISSFLLSFEYNQEILPFFDVFTFFDAGSVSDERFKWDETLRTSVGVGMRLEIMTRAPIVLGYGYPINPERKDEDVQNFFFSMAGQF
ncbi:MAG: outer membrane protein assembly factor BamA [Chlamydiota bacterium]